MRFEGDIYKSLINKYSITENNTKRVVKTKTKVLNEGIKKKEENPSNDEIKEEKIKESLEEETLTENINDCYEYVDRLQEIVTNNGFILDDSVTKPLIYNFERNTHLQIINPDIEVPKMNEDDMYYFLRKNISNILKDLDTFNDELENGNIGYITYNFGINNNYQITAGLDIRFNRNVVQEDVIQESVDKKEGEKKMSEPKKRGWDPDEHIKKVAKYYRDWAGFGEDEVLTEDMLKNEDWRLRRVSALKNTPVRKIKAELLKQKDSE